MTYNIINIIIAAIVAAIFIMAAHATPVPVAQVHDEMSATREARFYGGLANSQAFASASAGASGLGMGGFPYGGGLGFAGSQASAHAGAGAFGYGK